MLVEQIMNKLNKIEELLSNQPDRPLSISEACAYLHLSKSYLYKLTCTRQIPFYKPNGKIIVFKKSDLEAWIFRYRQSTDEELDAEADAIINRKK